MHNPQYYYIQRQRAITIANAVADACITQHGRQRWFAIENPQRSDIWRLPKYLKMSRLPGVRTVVFDQCCFGLRDEDNGEYIKKPTTVLTNLNSLAEALDRRCDQTHSHQRLEGGSRVRKAQTWPIALARTIAQAIVEGIDVEISRSLRHRKVTFAATTENMYPVQFDLCPGCRGRRAALDPSHTRVLGECRWSDEGEMMERSRAWAPRNPRKPKEEKPLRERSRKKEQTEQVVSEQGPAAGSATLPGEADTAQEIEVEMTRSMEPLARPQASTSASSSSTTKAVTTEGDEENEEVIDDKTVATRKKRITITDSSTQASNGVDAPDAAAYDLTRVGSTLRREGQDLNTVRSIIRRLHHRWWHASAPRTRKILEASGQPARVLDEIESVVDSCAVCRSWKRPHGRPQSSSTLPSTFNDRVQADILWIDGQPTLHLVDEATRFCQARFLNKLTDEEVMEALAEIWLRTFGAMKVMTSDQESGIKSDYAGITLSRWGVQRVLLPEGRHAGIVERHHALLRNTYHHIRDQLHGEGSSASAAMILAETVHAHNVLVTTGGHTPFEAVFGRTPPMLHLDPEHETHEALLEGETDLDRMQRVREISLQAMIKNLAEARIKRAKKSQTHQAAGEVGYKTGDLCDFFRTPQGKATSGWRGPATIVDVSTLSENGIAHVRWQGRIMSVQARDLRPHLVIPVWLLRETTVYEDMFSYIDSLYKTSQLFSVYVHNGEPRPTHHAALEVEIYASLRRFAAHELGLSSDTFLVGNGIRKIRLSIERAHDMHQALLLAWPTSCPHNIMEQEFDVTEPLALKEVLGKDYMHFSWVVIVYDAITADHQEKEEDDDDDDDDDDYDDDNRPQNAPPKPECAYYSE
eukprot:1928904-Amphidinium_carterae.2